MKGKLLKLVVGLAVTGVMAYLGWHYFDELYKIRQVTPVMFVLLAALFLVTRWFQGEVFYATVKTFDVRISHYRAFMLSMVINLVNLLVPRTGMSAPAFYLKSRHNLKYADFGSMLTATVLLQTACLGLLGLACMVWLWAFEATPFNGWVAMVLAVVLTVSVFFMVKVPRLPEGWHGRLAEFIRRFFASWSVLAADRRLMAYVTVLQVAVLITQGFRLWVCFYAMGVPVSLSAAMLASLLGQIGVLVGLTPGGLGFRETGILLGAYFLKVDPDTVMTAAILDRAVMTAATMLVGGVGSWQLLRTPSPEAAATSQPVVGQDESGNVK
jgi:uncharacterized protein (TIRG00374 family)